MVGVFIWSEFLNTWIEVVLELGRVNDNAIHNRSAWNVLLLNNHLHLHQRISQQKG